MLLYLYTLSHVSLPACFPDTCFSISFYFLFSSLSASPHFYYYSWSLILLSSYHVFHCMFVPSFNIDFCLYLHVLKHTCHTQAWGGNFHFQRFFVWCEGTSECLGILGNRTPVSEQSRFFTLFVRHSERRVSHLGSRGGSVLGPAFVQWGSRTMALFSLQFPSLYLSLKFLSFSLRSFPFVYFCQSFQFHFLHFSLFFLLFRSCATPFPVSFFDFVS